MHFSCCCCFCCCCWGGGGTGNLATKGTKNVRLKEGGSVCMCPPLHLVQEPIQFNSILYSHYIRFLSYYYHRSVLQFLFAEYPPHSGADLGGGCRGCAPPPEMTCGFLIQLVHPLLKKILDPPLTLEEAGKATAAACKKCFPSARRTLHS